MCAAGHITFPRCAAHGAGVFGERSSAQTLQSRGGHPAYRWRPAKSVGRHDEQVAAPAACRRHVAGAARPGGTAGRPIERSASSAESRRVALAAEEPASQQETLRSDALRLFGKSLQPHSAADATSRAIRPTNLMETV
jgi:hypothetical protein